VEGACGGATSQPEPAQAPLQLARGAPGEGDGQHVLRVGRAVEHPSGDAVADDARLAGPGGGQDDQRRGLGEHSLALGAVEPLQQRRLVHVRLTLRFRPAQPSGQFRPAQSAGQFRLGRR